jgi:dihydrofolate synthase / folylpolyglutamate synthase
MPNNANEQLKQYHESVAYLETLATRVKKDKRRRLPSGGYDFTGFGLDRTLELCKRLGNPQHNLKVIHIGGTSGKGSTTMFASHILQAAGYKTGTYISPFLTTTAERIRINNTLISANEFSALSNSLKPIIEEMEQHSPFGAPSYFEVMLAMALLYFQAQQVDVAVIEVGIGGTIDATNVCQSIVSVITNVSLAHTRILGNTVKQIARDKSGIIKKDNLACITAATHPDAIKAIITTCEKQRVPLKHITSKKLDITSQTEHGTTFHYTSAAGNIFNNLRIKMPGHAQVLNAACAVEALLQAAPILPNIDEDSIKKGLKNTTFPGRLERMQANPRIIIDGAHNNAKAEFLAETLTSLYTYEKLIVVLGIVRKDEAAGIIKHIAPIAHEIIITKPNFPTNEIDNLDAIKTLAQQHANPTTRITINPIPKKALEEAKKRATTNDLICITGSLYLIGDVRTNWLSEKTILKQRSDIIS